MRVRTDAPTDVLRELLRRVDHVDEPGGSTVAATALGKLRGLTLARADNEIGTELQAAAYMERLAAYPADVIVAVCAAWPDRSRWWPSWFELGQALDRRRNGRAAVRRKLREVIDKRERQA